MKVWKNHNLYIVIFLLCVVFSFSFSVDTCAATLESMHSDLEVTYSKLYYSYIGCTDVKINSDVENPGHRTVTHVGARLWDSNNNLLAEGQFSITPWTEATGWQTQTFTDLMTNTSYYFQLFTIADGKTFYSDKKKFTTEKMLGDVDLNGSIEALDALCILKHAVKIDTLEDNQAVVADIEKDGDIDAKDALRLLKIVVGLINLR